MIPSPQGVTNRVSCSLVNIIRTSVKHVPQNTQHSPQNLNEYQLLIVCLRVVNAKCIISKYRHHSKTSLCKLLTVTFLVHILSTSLVLECRVWNIALDMIDIHCWFRDTSSTFSEPYTWLTAVAGNNTYRSYDAPAVGHYHGEPTPQQGYSKQPSKQHLSLIYINPSKQGTPSIPVWYRRC